MPPQSAQAITCPSPITLANPSFETPVIPDATYQIVSGASVPGWTSTQNEFEIWGNGFSSGSGGPVYAPAGRQFVELNANRAGTVYQDINTTQYQGSTFTYSFQHRGRAGTDVMAIQIGPAGGAATFTRQVSTGQTWTTYTGSYRVPVGQTSTRFAYAAVSTATGNISVGNFLDNIQFGTPVCETDLSVTKTGTPDPYIPGQAVSYTVVVRNPGTFDVTGATFTDNAPTSLTGVTWTCTATTGSSCNGASGSGNTISKSLNLISGGQITFTITGTATSTSPPTTIANTATIALPSGLTDTNPADNSATFTLTRGNASLTLSKTSAYTGPLRVGDTFDYRFTVTNNGTVSLTNVRVTDPLVGLGTITCPATTLTPGQSTTCSASYTVTQADVDRGSISNTATATGTPPGSITAPTATSSLVINGTRTPGITLTKRANPSTGVVTGDQVTYSFTVVNSGNVTLTNVRVTDPLSGLSAISCPTTTLAPGISTVCTATYTVTQANVNAGSFANTATATGTPPTGTAPTATSSATVTTNRRAGIDIVKSSTYPGGLIAGQTINYRFTVTNTGTVTLTGVTVTDPFPGLSAISCPTTTLNAGQSTACTATYVIKQSDVDAGVVRNTATTTGTPPTGMTAPTATDTEETPSTRTATISFTKTASPSSSVRTGDIVTYSFRVINTGNVTLTNLTIADPLTGLSAISCPQTTLAPGETVVCTATRTVTQSDVNTGPISNTATASASAPTGVTPPTATSSATVTPARTTGISISKTSTTTNLVAGQTIPYSFLVTNTGTVTLTSVTVTDPLPGMSAIACPQTTLNAGQSTTCTATYVVTQANVNSGSLTNTANATGTPPSGLTAPVASNSLTISGTRTPRIALAKSASPNSGVYVGDTITYSLQVTNSGNVTLTNVTVTDPMAGLSAISCPQTTLAPGEGMTCTATYTVTESNVTNRSFSNTATATGTPPAGLTAPTTTSSTTVTTAPPRADLSVTKTVSPNPYVPGGPITYTIVISNAGPFGVTGATFQDTIPATVTGVTWTCSASAGSSCGSLATGGSGNTISGTVNILAGGTITITVTGIAPP